MHLPQLRSHPQLPHAHQPLPTAAHDLPVVHLHRRDAQVVAIERGRGGGGGFSQVEHPDPESQQINAIALFETVGGVKSTSKLRDTGPVEQSLKKKKKKKRKEL